MTKEQEPQSLKELQEKRTKIDRALAKIEVVSQTIGTSTFNRRFDLSRLSGEEFLEAAVKVGRVQEALKEKARPTLIARKEEVEREIENFDRIQKARQKFEEVRQFVQRGLLPRSALEKAKEALDAIREGLAPTLTPVTVPPRFERIASQPESQTAIEVDIAVEEEKRKEKVKTGGRGEVLVLPDGKELHGLSLLQRRVIERLLLGSLNNPVSRSELEDYVYPDRLKIPKAGIESVIRRVQKKLGQVNLKVISLVPKGRPPGNEEIYYYLYLAPKEGEVKVGERPKLKLSENRNMIEIDGRKIRLTLKQLKVLQVLARRVGQPIASRQLSKDALGEIDPHRSRLREFVQQLKEKINSKEGEEFLVSSGLPGSPAAWYMLRGVEVVWSEEEEVLSKTKIVFDCETFEVLINDQVVEISKDIEREVFLYLAKNAQKAIPSKTIAEVAMKAGSKFRRPARDVINGLRRILEVDPKNPQILISGGRTHGAFYLLNAEIEFVGESESERVKKYKEAFLVSKIVLPDGQEVTVRGKITARALQILVDAYFKGEQVTTDEVAKILYGRYDEKTCDRVSFLMRAALKKVLETTGWRIIRPVTQKEKATGQKAKYSLEKTVEEEKEAPEEEFAAPSEGEAGFEPKEVIGEIPTEEVEVIPYEPSEEEKRSEEETRILDVIVSSLLSNPKLRFEVLQRQLFSQERINQMSGVGLRYDIYQAQELKEKFASAFRKMREEAEIFRLRALWKDEEKWLWEKVQLLLSRLSGGDVEDFIQKIKREIDRAEKEFFRNYPPENNQKNGWIRL